MDLTFVEMFSGIGGFRLGLERSGWKCVWANDIDKYANQVYKKKFGDDELVEGDIREVDARQIPDHTLLTAGFPCQTFSVSGKRKGTNESRGTLFTHIARVTSVKRPKLLLLENVEGLLFNDSGKTFATILRVLGGLGYLLEWQVFNSKDFGTAQNRRRIFIVGHNTEDGRNPRTIFPIKINQSKKTIQIITEITGDTPSGLSRQGDRLYDIGGVSPTLTSQFIECALPLILLGDKIRPLTPIECERLQSLPENHTEGILDKTRYGLIGNSVTVNIIEFLGNKLRECLEVEVCKIR